MSRGRDLAKQEAGKHTDLLGDTSQDFSLPSLHPGDQTMPLADIAGEGERSQQLKRGRKRAIGLLGVLSTLRLSAASRPITRSVRVYLASARHHLLRRWPAAKQENALNESNCWWVHGATNPSDVSESKDELRDRMDGQWQGIESKSCDWVIAAGRWFAWNPSSETRSDSVWFRQSIKNKLLASEIQWCYGWREYGNIIICDQIRLGLVWVACSGKCDSVILLVKSKTWIHGRKILTTLTVTQ